MMKSKKKKKIVWPGDEPRKSPAEDVPEGATGKDGSPPPCRTLDGSVQQDFSVLSTVNMWGQIMVFVVRSCPGYTWVPVAISMSL